MLTSVKDKFGFNKTKSFKFVTRTSIPLQYWQWGTRSSSEILIFHRFKNIEILNVKLDKVGRNLVLWLTSTDLQP